MSAKEVDQRVVQMDFDNSKFEKNTRTTMNTLKELDEQLQMKDSGKGLDEVSHKFSTLEVVAISALSTITSKITDTGLALAKSLTVDQITSGMDKYEKKTANVQTLLNSTGKTIEEVNGYLEELQWYSDETSYSFTDMTSALSTMTTSGGDIEKLIPMIEGVANATAYAGKGASEFSRVMYNLNQSYSQGYLTYMDWKSVMQAGADSTALRETLIETAAALGKVKKASDGTYKTLKGTELSTSTFTKTLSEGWADTEVMEEGFSKFSTLTKAAYAAVEAGEYETTSEAINALAKDYDNLAVSAFKSAQEAKTFTEAIDATKDATSSQFTRIFEAVFGNYEQAKVLWTDLANELYDMFVVPISDTADIIESSMSSNWSKLSDQLEKAGIDVEEFEDKCVDAAEKSGVQVKASIEKFGIEESLTRGWLSGDTIREVLASYGQSASEGMDTADDVVQKVLDGEYGTWQKRWDKLQSEGYNATAVQNKVNAALGSQKVHLEELSDVEQECVLVTSSLSDEELKATGYTEEQISKIKEMVKEARVSNSELSDLIDNISNPSGRSLLVNAFKNLGDSIKAIVNSVSEAFNKVFGSLDSGKLYSLIEKVNEFTESIKVNDETAEHLQKIFEGLFHIIHAIYSIVKIPIKLIKTLAEKILSKLNINIWDVTDSIADVAEKIDDWISNSELLNSVLDILANVLTPVIKYVQDLFNTLRNSSVVKEVTNFFNNMHEALNNIIEDIKKKGFVKAFKDIFSGLANGISSSSSNVISSIKSIVEKLVNTFKELLGIHSPSTVFEGFGENIIDGLSNGLSEKVNDIPNFFKDLLSKVKDVFAKIDWDQVAETALTTFGGIIGYKLTDAFQSLASGVEGIGAAAKGVGSLLSSTGAGVSKFLTRAGKGVKSFLKSAGSSAIISSISELVKSLAILLGVIAAIVLLVDDTGKFNDVMNSVIRMLYVLAGVVTVITVAAGKISADQKSLLSLTALLVGTAASLLILSIACKNFAQIDSNAIGTVLAVIVSFIVGIAALVLVSRKTIDLTGSLFIKIAGAFAILAVALKILSGLDPAGAIIGLLVITYLYGIMVGLIALVIALSAVGGTSAIESLGTMMLAISASFILMAIAINILGKIKPETAVKGILILTYLVDLVAILMLCTQMLGNNEKNMTGFGTMMLGIGASFALMAIAIKAIGSLDTTVILKGIAAITVLTGLVVALMAASKLMGNGDLKTFLGMSAFIVAFAASLIVLSIAMKIIATMSVEEIAKSLGAIEALFAGLFFVMAASKNLSSEYKTLIVVAVIMALLALIVVGFSFMETDKLLTSVAALTIMLAGLSLLMKSMQEMKVDDKITKTLALVMVVVVLCAAIVILMSQFDTKNAITNATAVAILLVAIAGALYIISKTDLAKMDLKKTITVLASLSVVCALLGLILAMMTALDVKNAITNATALSILLVAMAGALFIISSSDMSKVDFKTVIVMLGSLTVVCALLGLILAMMSGMSVENAIPNAIALSVLLTSLSFSMIFLAAAGKAGFKAVLAGVVGLVAVVAALAGLLYVFGSLNGDGKFAETLDKGVEIFGKIGEAIGALVGGIIAGFSEEIMTILPALGEALAGFATPFSKVDDKCLAGISIVALAIVELTAASMISGLMSLGSLGVSLPALGLELSLFAANIFPFLTIMSAVPSKAFDNVAALSDAVLKLTAAELIDGIASFLGGNTSLADLGGKLVEFGDYVAQFADKVKGIDSDAVNAASSAANVMMQLANNLPSDGSDSLLSAIVGKKMDLSTFGNQLGDFARAIVNFSTRVKGNVDYAAVSNAKAAAALMVALCEDLPVTDKGLLQYITGSSSLSSFGGQLKEFGQAMVDFSDTVSGHVSQAAAKNAAAAADIMVALFKELPNTDKGLVQYITGSSDLGTFGDQLTQFGEGIAGMSDAVKGHVDTKAVESVEQTAELFVNLMNAMPNIGGVASLFEGDQNLGTLGEQVAKFAGYLVSVSNAFKEGGVTKDDADILKSYVYAAKTFIDTFSGEIATLTIGQNLGDFSNKMSRFVEIINNFTSELESSGATTGMEEITDNLGKLYSSIQQLTNLTEYDSISTFDAGIYFCQGFIDGVDSKIDDGSVAGAGKKMAKAAYDASVKFLQEKSPSKKTKEVGKYFGLGFIKGVGDTLTGARTIGEKLASSANSGLTNSISRISDAINSDIDTNPTITPVLDLTNIQNGAGQISNLFSTARSSIGVLGSVGTISSQFNANNANKTTNGDVVSAIDKLNDNIGNTRGDSYNINGISYSEGTEVANAIQTLVKAVKIEGRV